MKFRLGAFVAVIAAALLIVPPLLGRVSANAGKDDIVLQIDNPQAIHAGELQPIATQGAAALAPYNQDGSTMLPMDWIVAQMQAAEKKPQEQPTVAAAAVEHSGAQYVPLRTVTEAYGWNAYYIEDAQGGLVFLDHRKKSSEPDDKQISAALELLGPSHTQMLAKGFVSRVGSGTAVVNASRVELKSADDKKFQGVIEQSGTVYLPVESTAKVLGGSAAASGDTVTVTLPDGKQTTLTNGKVGSQSAENYTLYTDENGVVYASAPTMAAAFGLHACTPAQGVVALTAVKVDGFAAQMSYLAALGTGLPDKKPDIPDAKGYIALTFDDGPTGGKTGRTVQLLNGLKERGAHATFFMCGYRIKDFHTHMARYLAEGHELGNHTMDHPGVLTKYSADKVLEQFTSNNEMIKSYCGEVATVGRPVGGAYNDMVLEQMKKAGLPCINWSLDTLDWKYRHANRIKNVIVNQAKDGDIVLMHDLHQPTIDGVLAAIDELQQQGYAFVTVQELAQVKGVTLEPGKVYTSFN